MKPMLKILLFGSLLPIAACKNNTEQEKKNAHKSLQLYAAQRLAGYAPVKLTADLSALSEKEKQMIPLLIEAAAIMDDLYWQQSYGNKDSLLNAITDSTTREFARINYGPWDKLNNDTPFIAGVGTKPPGGEFYPHDMTKE